MKTEVETKLETKDQLIQFIVESAVEKVEKFLTDHPDLEFYAFAFNCDLENEADILLYFNTEPDFEETLKSYQSGPYAEKYVIKKNIESLKYNVGDWKYEHFAYIEFPEDPDWYDRCCEIEFLDDRLDLYTLSLIEFTNTETYKKIPKTADFKAFCVEHDEEYDTAIERLSRLKQAPNGSKDSTRAKRYFESCYQ